MSGLKQIWVDKYRPASLDDYVFQDDHLKYQIKEWIESKSIPHLLFRGGPGTGKTTLAKIILNELNIQSSDVLFANGSKECRKIEWVDKLISFCSTMPFGDFKVVLIDEADYMNQQSVQPSLRNLIEDFGASVRFILTCNYGNKIIPPLHSRFQTFHIEKSDLNEFTERAATILINEGIDFNLETLDTFVKGTYPDLRKCINNLESNCRNGQLILPVTTDDSSDYKIQMVDLFQRGKISEARKLICSQALPEEMEDIYRWLYNNVSMFGDEANQDKAILIIKEGLVDHNFIADPEINLAATLIRLARI